MHLYTVQYREQDGGDPDVVLVKEGFCWPALFLPLIWLLYRLQFWGLAAYALATGLLSGLVAFVGLDPVTGLLLSLVLSLLVAAVANDWRRWRLAAKGYELMTVIAAGNLAQAEEIFFHQIWRRDAATSAPPETQPFTPLPASGLTPFATPFDPV
jgi:hypothetical protein